MNKRLLLVTGLIILIISAMSLFACTSQSTIAQTTTPSITDSTPTSTQGPGTMTIPEVITKVKPSVVSINVEITAYDIFNRPVKEEGAGSGWIIDSDGYVVTNNHVVENADNVTVILDDGRVFQAESVKTDPLTVPHPGLHERDFVIIPLAEIAGNLNIPGKGLLSTLIAACENHSVRKLVV